MIRCAGEILFCKASHTIARKLARRANGRTRNKIPTSNEKVYAYGPGERNRTSNSKRLSSCKTGGRQIHQDIQKATSRSAFFFWNVRIARRRSILRKDGRYTSRKINSL